MRRRVQNPQSYATDSPVTLAPGETAEVENSPDLERQLEAGVLREVEDDAEVKPLDKPTRSTRKDQDK